MRLSTRTRYGCRALAEVAAAYPDGTPCVREIAEKQRLSPKYLESIMQVLKAAGLVRAERGAHGGYGLTRPPGEISMREVVRVLEGPSAPVPCVDAPDLCGMAGGCPTRDMWVEMRVAIDGVLDRRTLQDLAARCGSTKPGARNRAAPRPRPHSFLSPVTGTAWLRTPMGTGPKATENVERP